VLLVTDMVYMNATISETNYKEPLYVIRFDISGAAAEIFLNDIPVYWHKKQSKINSEISVPDSMLNGKNTLKVRTYATNKEGFNYREGAVVNIALNIRESSAALSTNKPLLKLNLELDKEEGDILKSNIASNTSPSITRYKDNELVIENSIDISHPFNNWAWQNGKTIEESEQNRLSLLAAYNSIYLALKNEDMASLKALYSNAADEYQKAYFLSSIDSAYEFMSTGDHFGNKDWSLPPLEENLKRFDFKLDVYGNGKLARIVNERGQAPIVYINHSSGVVNFLKFGFYLNNNNEWIMIR